MVSAALFVAEALCLDTFPRIVPIIAFLHITSIGSLLISAFWSHVNESFDPNGGKKVVARIEGAAALGGVFGGITAERLANATSTPSLLFLCAALCGLAFLFSWWRKDSTSSLQQARAVPIPTAEIVKNRYIQSLAAIVILVAIGSTLLGLCF